MKSIQILAPLTVALALTLTGCGDCNSCGHDHEGVGAAPTTSTGDSRNGIAAVEQAFASAETSVKASADKAIAAVKKADYATALGEAQRLINDVKLTPQQKEAVGTLISQLKTSASDAAAKVNDAAAKVSDAAQKAADQLKQSLPPAK